MLLHCSRCTSPHRAKSGIGREARATTAPAGAPAPALPTLLRMRRACSLTSSCEMRPAGPLPATELMSTPISRARRRTAGEAAAGMSLDGAVGAAGEGEGAEAGAGAGASTGCLGGIETTLASAFGSGLDSGLGSALTSAGGAGAAATLPAPLPEAPASSTVKITAPTCTLSPFLTLISLTTPATDEG